MIPKIIHYCWFGRGEKTSLAKKCVASWMKKCPNYEIIEWNEDNYDISSAPLYVQQAYEAQKWAFVTDYVRLQVVYEHGGIYLDTDVELKKAPTRLLKYDAYFGLEVEEDAFVATGLGFGAIQGCTVLAEIMEQYHSVHFVREDGSLDLTPCPKRNTAVFEKHGLVREDKMQILDSKILVLPTIYLCPVDYTTHKKRFSFRTISVHHFAASWNTPEDRARLAAWQRQYKKIKRGNTMHRLAHLPNRIMRRMLGNRLYEAMKRRIKR